MQQHILVIEDQPDVRENIEELLVLSNFRVSTAAHGKEGAQLAIANPPDLILCDIMMPEMDGYEVLYILSRNPKTAAIPFIFLSAKAEKADFRKGMNLGADDYLTKPFEEIDLLSTIERRLKKHQEVSKTTDVSDLAKIANEKKDLERFQQNAQHFERKDTIYREGDYSNFVYKIISGKVKTYHINPDGKELISDIKSEGSYLGENSVIQETPRTEFAEALEPTTLMPIPKADFLDLLFHNRDISTQLIKLLSNRVSQREHELMDMAYNTVRKRTADALMRLYHAYKTDQNEKVTIETSRSDLAGMVGTATESVIRILSEFKKEQLISIDGSKITLLAPETLEGIKY